MFGPDLSLGMTLRRIEDLWTNPCHAPFFLYFRLGLTSALDVFRVLLVPSPQEVAEEYFDPSGTRGASKRKVFNPFRIYGGGGGGPKHGRKGGFPDPDSWVSERLPGREVLATRKISNTEFIAWSHFNTLERAAWYAIIYESTKETIFHWHSGYLAFACFGDPIQSGGHWHRDLSSANVPSSGPPESPEWTQDYLYNVSATTGSGRVFLLNPSTVNVIFTVDFFRHSTLGDGNTQIRLDVKDVHGATFSRINTHHVEPFNFHSATLALIGIPEAVEIIFYMQPVLGQIFQVGGNATFGAQSTL